jgi:hypothetical protein
MACNEVARLCQAACLVVVLDAFPYLLEADPSLARVRQRDLDQRLRRDDPLLFLTGSHAGMIEREALSCRSPRYNRHR